MGCFNAKTKATDRIKGVNKIEANKAREQQGIAQLKQNYVISGKTKVLGAGTFGKVFKTTSTKDKNHVVAIKVLDKVKLENHIE